MLNLKEKERAYLDALEETCKKYEMDDYYSIGIPREKHISICKRDKIWEVFIVEKGREYAKTSHKECIDACIQVLNHCSYNIEEFELATNEFKNILLKNNQNKLLKKCKL